VSDSTAVAVPRTAGWSARSGHGRTASTNGALCLRRRRLGSRYAAQWLGEMEGGNNLSRDRKRGRRAVGITGDHRPARSHGGAAGNCCRLAGLGLIRFASGQFVMRAAVVHHRHGTGCGCGCATARVSGTRRFHGTYREVERADSSDDSYNTSHNQCDSSSVFGRLQLM
jgi:hypothetical protein